MKHPHDMKKEHDHHQHGHDHAEEPPPSACGGCACSAVPDAASPITVRPKGKAGKTWEIPGMDCPVEEKEIREALAGIDGIQALFFHFSSRSLTIEATEAARKKAFEAIKKAGFKPKAVDFAGEDSLHDHDHAIVDHRTYWKLGIALVIALSVEIFHLFAPENGLFQIMTFLLAVSAIALAGISVYLNGIRALLHGRLNISALMAVAVTGACLLGQWPEAAMVMVLYVIAELIEARSVDRARHAIRQLLSLAPETAERKLPGANWAETPVSDIRPGEVVRVKPGGRIPLDGKVVSGHSAVNQMAVTGESIPVAKTVGDIVYAGSINESGVLEFDVTAQADDTMLARIIKTVEKAQEARAPVQRFVDRFAAIYTPLIFFIALAVAVLMPLLVGWAWKEAIYRALVLLVIACPCALVIATPLTIVSALAAAAREGILIKGGVYLEEARRLKAVALDKTGTITEGHLKLVAAENIAGDMPEAHLHKGIAAMASHSCHPVSRAIFARFKDDGQQSRMTHFIEMPGKGIQASIDGKTWRLGSVRWLREHVPLAPEWESRLQIHEKSGHTVTLLASEEKVLAFFAVADTIRGESRKAVEALSHLKITPVMLTGDNALTARSIALAAGISNVQSNLLPEDKSSAIQSLQAEYGPVAMVGDGINDAPALAVADIGIAMGGAGADIALETADVVIMNDNLGRVTDLIRLSHRTFRVLRQNIGIALFIKLVFFSLAFFGHASMWMAVFADVGATLIVVFNGLRLLGAIDTVSP